MEQKRPYFRRVPAAEEEEKVWVSFYRNAHDPDLAAELIAHLDKDADSRMQYPGLYLRCKQSVRRHREREARAKRAASAVRMLLRLVVQTPVGVVVLIMRQMRVGARFGGDVALHVCDGDVPPGRTSKAKTPTAKCSSSDPPTSAPAAPNAVEVEPSAARECNARSA